MYYPEGTSDAEIRPSLIVRRQIQIQPGTPLIWSPGRALIPQQLPQEDFAAEEHRADTSRWILRYGWSPPISDREAIAHGASFPLISPP